MWGERDAEAMQIVLEGLHYTALEGVALRLQKGIEFFNGIPFAPPFLCVAQESKHGRHILSCPQNNQLSPQEDTQLRSLRSPPPPPAGEALLCVAPTVRDGNTFSGPFLLQHPGSLPQEDPPSLLLDYVLSPAENSFVPANLTDFSELIRTYKIALGHNPALSVVPMEHCCSSTMSLVPTRGGGAKWHPRIHTRALGPMLPVAAARECR